MTSRTARLKPAVRIVFMIFAAGALVWLLNDIGWSKIADAFLSVGVPGAALLLSLGFLENILDAAAWNATLEKRLGLYRILSYNCAGAVVNNIVPGEAGEILKGTLLRKHASTGEAIAGTVIWNYVFKLTRPLVAFTAAVCAFVFGHTVETKIALLVLGATVLAFAPYLLLKILLSRDLAQILVRVIGRLRFLKLDTEKLLESAATLDRSIRTFWRDRPRDYVRVFLLQVGARTTAWLTLFAAARLMDLGYGFGLCSLIYAGFSVASYVVMMLPARLGVSEGAGYLTFSLFGLDAGIGVILYMVLRVKALVTNGLLAIFGPKS